MTNVGVKEEFVYSPSDSQDQLTAASAVIQHVSVSIQLLMRTLLAVELGSVNNTLKDSVSGFLLILKSWQKDSLMLF